VSRVHIARAAERTLAALGRAGASVEIRFVDDDEIRQLNRAWRGIGRRTDAAEVALLVTHGVLHLVGYDDRDPLEARLMHERERQILSAHGLGPPDRLWKGLLHA
jgi:ssRNA-specific RNase YbeY (16S rRNA maturation enzyme)